MVNGGLVKEMCMGLRRMMREWASAVKTYMLMVSAFSALERRMEENRGEVASGSYRRTTTR